jgi:hypothetical protein
MKTNSNEEEIKGPTKLKQLGSLLVSVLVGFQGLE